MNDIDEAPRILSVEPTRFSDVAAPSQGQTVPLEFTVFRSGDGDDLLTATVDWELRGLSAADFPGGLLPTGTVEFVGDSNTASVIVQVPASVSLEALREAVLRLNTPSAGYAIDPDNAQAIVRIIDDANVLDGGQTFRISADKYTTLLEGAAGEKTVITYTVTRIGGTFGALEVGYALGASGSALVTADDFANQDGTPLSALPAGRITFADGSPTATFTITVRGDDAVGPDEAFDITLTDLPNGSQVIGKTSGVIVNDDAYISVVAQAIANAGNGDVTHSFIVKRAGALGANQTVAYTITGVGEQATDRFNNAGQITFAEGEEEKVISFTTPAGQAIAGYQTFAIQLQDADGNFTLLNDRATSSINPNLQDVELSANADRVLEGTKTEYSFNVTRSGVVDGPLTIGWSVESALENGVSAADFDDGVLPSGEVTFAANQATATITFRTRQDAILEGTEGFLLKLVSENLPAGIRLITPQIEGFISDDESAVGFRQDTVAQAVEGDSGATSLSLTVSRIGFSGSAATVEWRVTPETASLADLAPGQDLLGDNGGYPSGVLTLLPGQLSADITVRIAGDASYESGLNETFAVTLSNASADTKIVGTQGIDLPGYSNVKQATIVNDDALIGLEASLTNVVEGNGGSARFVEITVTRSGSTVGEDSVKWSLSSIQTGATGDSADLGIENSAIGVFNKIDNSWIDLADFKGSQSAQGTVQITKSGYIMVAYNRDERFRDADDGNPIFDQFVLKNLSISGGAILSAVGPVADNDYIASNVALSGYGQSIFADASGVLLPGVAGEGQHVVISSANNLAGMYFRVSGLDVNGQPLTEIIQGSNGGASATAALFTKVAAVETLAPQFAVGKLEIPTDNVNYQDSAFFSNLQVPWTAGDAGGIRATTADSYGVSERVAGAEFTELGIPVLRSDADLSDATFVIKGGVSVANFSSFSPGQVNVNFQKGKGDYGQDELMRLDVPQFVRGEQVSGIFQSIDGSSAPNRFMITGLNQQGEQISEIIAVQDFDADALAAVNSYAGGNLLTQSVSLEGGARLMISTNGQLTPNTTVILDEAFILQNFGMTLNQIDSFSVFDIYSGSVERFNGTTWENVQLYGGIDKLDFAAGNIRAQGSELQGASIRLSVYDTNYVQKILKVELITSTEFTISGRDAQGRAISETISAPDFNFRVDPWGRGGDKATVATKKAFDSIDSVVASKAFSGNIQIGLSNPVETTNAFTAIYSVAAVDAQGNYIDPNGGGFSGKFEFTVPIEVAVKGPSAGVAISPYVMNYIQSIEIQRNLPADISVNIGYQASDLNTPIPGSDGFLVLQSADNALTAAANNNFLYNTNFEPETGNIRQDRAANIGYAIFKVDAPTATIDNPVTISFDIAQLGRYGVDVGRIGYAPDGTFSTNVNDLITDGQNLLIPVVEATGADTVVSKGAVELPGSGYVWVRYANLSDGIEGRDQATINGLYVDQGAKLTIVGQKAFSDGIANFQSISGNTDLTLNGVSVSYKMPDHAHLEGSVLVYIRQPNIKAFDGLGFDFVGKTAAGETIAVNMRVGSFQGSDRPSDGMATFRTLESLGVTELERLTWEEETSNSQLWEPIFGIVKGSLNNLANDVPFAASGRDLFNVDYDLNLFRPGITTDVSGRQIPMDQLLPEFARSILYAQEITAQGQSLSVAVQNTSAERITLTSTQDLSSRQITVSGTGADGNPLVEVIDGPNATTIATIGKFLAVTGVSFASGDQSGQLSMGSAMSFVSPTALAARAFDGMPNSVVTARGLDANGEVVNVELRSAETDVAHPLGVFSELWSLTNNGLAADYLTVIAINPAESILSLNQYGSSVVNPLYADQLIQRGVTFFGDYVSPGSAGFSDSSPLVFVFSPELAGRTVVFYGSSPQQPEGPAYFQYVIPGDGLLVTPISFDWAYYFHVYAGNRPGRVSFGFGSPISGNSDLILKAETDFAGDLVLNGRDSNGMPISQSFADLAANAEVRVTGFAAITNYNYLGSDAAPVLNLTEVPKAGFFQSIPLSGEVDDRGYVVLDGSQHVVITAKGDGAAKQMMKVTGLVDGVVVTETLFGIAGDGRSAITKNQFTHLLKVEVGASDSGKNQLYSVGTVSPIIDEQTVSRYGADMKLGEAVAVFETPSKVSITSPDDLSTTSFLVTGRDAAGNQISETIVGPNASTVLSTKAFSQVDGIQSLGSATGQVKVGYITQAGGMVDGFAVSGGGTELNPFIGQSTNTLEAALDSKQNIPGVYSESDILLYVDTRGATGPVKLYYDLAVQGSAGSGANNSADRLYVEFSATETPLLSGEVVFADGQSVTKILVPIAGDDQREPDETLRLRLDAPSTGATLDNARRTGDLVILNDDDLVTLASAPQSGSEGSNIQATETLRFVVSRLVALGTIEVPWHISGLSSAANLVDGSAEADDFVSTSGVVTFEAGSLTAVIEVQLNADRLYEGNESFLLVLSEPPAGSGFSRGPTASVVGTILEDDVGLRIDAAGAASVETDDRSTHTFTVFRVGDVSQASSLVWSVAPTATASNTDALLVDFGGAFPQQQTLEFAAGEISKDIVVTSFGDNEMTGDRNFTLTVSNGVGDTTDVRAGTATGTIIEDDPVSLTLSPDQVRQVEASLPVGFKEFTYTVSRVDSSRAADYEWSLLLGDDPLNTVVSAADFETGQDGLGTNAGLPSGRFTFAAGELTKSLTIRVLSDALIEGDEAFKLHFAGADASQAAPQGITAYIVNDVVGYGIDVSYAGVLQGDYFLEGSDGTRLLKVTFFRAGGSNTEETLAFSMSGGASAPMTLADFDGLSAFPENEQIQFAIGQSAVTRTYVVRADEVVEDAETLSIVLSGTDGSTLASRAVTLGNDDSVVSLEAQTQSFTEGTVLSDVGFTTLMYRVYRTGVPDQISTVQWRVLQQGGIDAKDFVIAGGELPSGTVTFSAGDTALFKEFSINVRKDFVNEGVFEDLVVELRNPSAGTLLGTASATTRILDDDDPDAGGAFAPLVWSVNASTTRLVETNGDILISFTIERPTNSDPRAAIVEFSVDGDFAALGGYSADAADFLSGFGQDFVEFDDGVFTKQINISIKGDTLPENDETFFVSLGGVTRGVIDQDPNRSALTFTIANDDSNFSVTAGTPVLEGDVLGQAFVISRDFATDANQTIHWSLIGSGVNAASANDFAGPSSGTVTFTGTELTKTIYVPFTDDVDPELDETFDVTIALGEGALDDTIVKATAVGTILGDDSVLSVGFESGKDRIREGSGTDVQFVEFLISRNFDTVGPASVNWTITGAAVTAGLLVDTSGQVAFADGESVQRVRIAVAPNQVISGDQQFQVQLSNPIGSGLLPGAGDAANAVIVDDDSTLSIRGDARVIEGDSGSKAMIFVLDRVGGAEYSSAVGWRVVRTTVGVGDASEADFNGSLLPLGTLTLAAGQSQIQLAIPGIAGDRDIEGDETFRLELVQTASPDLGLSIDPARAAALGTIRDNDSQVNLVDVSSAVQPGLAAEGAVLTFTIDRTGYLGAVSFIDWNIASAESFSNGVGDFAQYSGTVKFGLGESRRTFTVNVNLDDLSELDELFRISLTSASSGTAVGVSESFFKVVNDDADRITLSAASPSQAEGDGSGYTSYIFTLTRENSLIDGEVDWVVAGSAPYPLDMARLDGPTSGTAVFEAGSLTTTIEVKVLRDDIGDFDRSFTLSVSNAVTTDPSGVVLVNTSASAVVQNDDPAIAVELASESTPEGSGTSAGLLTFRIVRVGDTTGTASVDWQLETDGPNGATLFDFGGYWPAGTAVFADGESVKTLQVAIAPDSNFEPDEGFKVVISNLVTGDPNARIIVQSASGVVANDDTGVFVSSASSTVLEGGSAQFTISAQGMPNTAVRAYWTLEGTGVSPANSNDYGLITGQHGFDPIRQAYYVDLLTDNSGNAQQSITVQTVDDKVLGADETLRLRIIEASDASVVEGRAIITILNDDALVAISPAILTQREGQDGATVYTFTVARTGNVSEAASVNYVVSGFGDNPTTEEDFLSASSGVVTFAPGDASATLELIVKGDTTFESDESFMVTLSAQSVSSSTQIDTSGSKAIGVIQNDDNASLVFKPISASVNEGTLVQNSLSYEIVRNGDNSQPLVVSFLITGVSIDEFDTSQIELVETLGGLSGTVTIPAGDTRIVLRLPIKPDAIVQSDSAFTVSISAAGFSAPAPIDSTIIDDDAGITLLLTSAPSAEGELAVSGEYVFTVSRSGSNLAETDVMWAVTELGDSAASGADFFGGILPAGVVSFQNGETEATITIKLAGDTIVENNEMFRLSLLASSDQTQRILVSSLDLTIVNDDFASNEADVIQTGFASDLIDAGAGDDRIETGGGADVVYAGPGNDIVFGQGGADAIYGGAGDDVFLLNADNIAHFNGVPGESTTFIDGGLGFDTIALVGSGIEIDLGAIVQAGQILGIEKVDISGDGANTLILALDALQSTDKDTDGMRRLIVDGDQDDTVTISDLENWIQGEDSNGYAVWTDLQGTAQLLIDRSVAFLI
ncbi:Calx-beta domain-containing protein [Novosphingobium sp. AAP83]|uniref:Calx-beta domain-containing protein n=1 Tax=Novosphingobium sp. AAP83 TaxID=1523425 RepID=UPI0018D14682|nr:Calx-beta domain-containing protein [Novosphingobium sp. AAP83]